MNLLRVVGLVVAELSLLLQDLVHLGGVRGGIVAAAGGGSGHGQNGGEHELRTESRHIISPLESKMFDLPILSGRFTSGHANKILTYLSQLCLAYSDKLRLWPLTRMSPYQLHVVCVGGSRSV